MPKQSVAWRPRLRRGTTTERTDGTIVLRHLLADGSVVLDGEQQAVLRLIDGERTFEEIAVEWCRMHHSADLETLLNVLARLRSRGLLEPGGGAEEEPAILSADVMPFDRARDALVWRRSSGVLRTMFDDAGHALAWLLASVPATIILTLLALSGVVLWAVSVGDDPVLLLDGATSYLPALLYLIAVNGLFSLMEAVVSAAVHRGFGLPPGDAFVGMVAGLPSVWVEPVEARELSAPRRLWLHMAGPVFGGAAAAVMTGLAAYQLPTYAEVLLIAATIGWLRLFASVCPFTASPFTRAVTAILDLPDLRLVALRMLPGGLASALAKPGDRTKLWPALWGLAMLAWIALALQLISLLIAPQLPPLLSDLASGPPLPQFIIGLLILAIFVSLSVGVLLTLGVLAAVALGRWIVAHPVWSRPGHQLLALLVVALVGIGALVWLSSAAPAATWPVALVLAGGGALAGWVAAILLLIEHRGGRVCVALTPLPLAGLLAAILVGLAPTASAEVERLLAAGVALLTAGFLFGWAALVWRRPSAWVGLAAAAALAGLAIAGGASAPGALFALVILTAVTALVAFGLQINTDLARTWLAVTLGAVIPATLLLLDPAGGLPTRGVEVGYTGVALLLAAGLVQWAWSLWSDQSVSPARVSRPAASHGDRLIGVLLTVHSRIAGPPAVTRVRRALERGVTEDDPRGRMRTLLRHLRSDIGDRVARRLLARACQSLPWEEYLAAADDLDLADDLLHPEEWHREELLEMLSGALPFAHVAHSQLERLLDHARLRRFEPGESIVQAGDPARWMNVLIEGSVELLTPPKGRHALARLHAGDTFGLEALAGGRSPVTVQAEEQSVTLSLHRDDLARLEAAEQVARELADLSAQVRSLRSTSVFHEMAEAQVASVLARARTMSFAKGEAIVRQGDPGDRFYVIRSGEVEVVRETEGEKCCLAELGPGECVGELALLMDLPRTATVTARTPVEALALERADFFNIFPPDDPGTRPLLRLSLSRVMQFSEPAEPGRPADGAAR